MTKAQENADAVVATWQEAYRDANNKEPPRVTYKAGWLTLHYGGSGVKRRLWQLEDMTHELRRRAKGG